MSYNYQDAPRESQQEYFGKVRTDNKETLHNALKRIEELEKENALLKGRNKGFEQQIMGLLIKYEEVYKRFPDLKSAMDKAKEILKENAELQAENKKTSNDWLEACNKYGEVNLRLTKAKDLIKNIIRVTWGEGWNYDLGWKVKAEQFLKETE